MTPLPTVEKGIPIPRSANGTIKAFVSRLEVNDSFVVKGDVDPRRARRRVPSAYAHWFSRLGYRYVTEPLEDGEHLRVWRSS